MSIVDVGSERTPVPAASSQTPRLAPLVVLSLGYFLVMLDVTAVTVAVPNIQDSLHAGPTGLQWVVDGYSTTFAALLLLGSGLGDRLGHRRVFSTGLVLFAAASMVCALAGTTGALVVGRVLQGGGAALLVPTSLALLADAYPERGSRARALGFWAAVAGVAFAVGPVVGGFLVAGATWRAVFWINVPVVAIAVALTSRHLPRPARAGGSRRRMDPVGQVTAMVGLALVAATLNEAATRGFGDPLVAAGLLASAAALTAFVLHERRLERIDGTPGRGRPPLLPMALFRRIGFAATATIGILLNLGYYGMLYLSTLYFQQERHYDAVTTGLALLPSVAMALIAAPLSGRLTTRFGPYLPMSGALLLGAVGFLGWLAAAPNGSYLALVFALVATGLATPMTVPAATAAIIESAPADRAAMASAVFNVARQVGNAVGVALFGTLAATSASLVAGLHLAAVIASAVFLAGSVLSLLASRNPAPSP
jgi:DHA2 family methylenomycin A resistance protein-like MFS transporter